MSKQWKRGRVLLRRMAEGVEPPFDIAERAFEFALMVVEFVLARILSSLIQKDQRSF